MEEHFSFEHTVHFTRKKYIQLWKTPLATENKKRRLIRTVISLLVLGLITGGCFFFTYTLALGIVLLILSTAIILLYVFRPPLALFATSSSYENLPYLHAPLTYKITEEGLFVKGENISCFVTWSLLVNWQVREDWLILAVAGIPRLYFPITALKKEKVYNPVLKKVKEYGTLFK